MIDGKVNSENGKWIVAQANKVANNLLLACKPKEIDCLAFIVNDLQGCAEYSIELWVNSRSVVEEKVEEGTPRLAARWLYENWSQEAVLGELVGDTKPSHSLDRWRNETDRVGLFNLAVAISQKIRQSVASLAEIPFIIDNNHEYDSLVFDAVKAANSEGQADEWLKTPPPDCE